MENTKPHKSDYTKRQFKEKGVYEAHQMTAEHAYLGEHRNHLESGYLPGGKIDGVGHAGTSKSLLKDASAGNVPKGKNTKY